MRGGSHLILCLRLCLPAARATLLDATNNPILPVVSSSGGYAASYDYRARVHSFITHTWRQVSRLVQEKLPAVFVEMAALVYADRPQSRFVMVYFRTLRLLDRISTNRTLHFRLEMDRNESFWSTWSS